MGQLLQTNYAFVRVRFLLPLLGLVTVLVPGDEDVTGQSPRLYTALTREDAQQEVVDLQSTIGMGRTTPDFLLQGSVQSQAAVYKSRFPATCSRHPASSSRASTPGRSTSTFGYRTERSTSISPQSRGVKDSPVSSSSSSGSSSRSPGYDGSLTCDTTSSSSTSTVCIYRWRFDPYVLIRLEFPSDTVYGLSTKEVGLIQEELNLIPLRHYSRLKNIVFVQPGSSIDFPYYKDFSFNVNTDPESIYILSEPSSHRGSATAPNSVSHGIGLFLYRYVLTDEERAAIPKRVYLGVEPKELEFAFTYQDWSTLTCYYLDQAITASKARDPTRVLPLTHTLAVAAFFADFDHQTIPFYERIFPSGPAYGRLLISQNWIKRTSDSLTIGGYFFRLAGKKISHYMTPGSTVEMPFVWSLPLPEVYFTKVPLSSP